MLRKEPIPEQPRPLPDGPLYFVGIGGAGMSALAQVLAERGRTVRGSDPGILPAVKERLKKAGAIVYTQHDAVHVGDATCVIVSDAVPEANPEVRLARDRGLPIMRRPEVLGVLVNAGLGIAIAGTHGKTTTTGMVASILLHAGLDPTIFLGGDLPQIGGNARNGKGDIVLAESCEAYDGFLYLHPEIAVVLNIEADHLDFHGTEQHMIESFERFLGQVQPQGAIIWCGDDEKAEQAVEHFNHVSKRGDFALLNYGLKPMLGFYEVSAADVDLSGPRPSFTLCATRQNGDEGETPNVVVGPVRLAVPGQHNVSNALAAAAVGLRLDVAPEHIIAGLESFTGTGRRFERVGEAGGILIVDDYAHHPTELRATLSAARSAYPDRRIVAVFQPHLPSRTRDLLNEFAEALTMADVVYLTDIYLAREQPLEGITSGVLAERTQAAKPGLEVVYVPNKADLPTRLLTDVRPGDLVLTLGAGDINPAGEKLFALLKEKHHAR